MPYSIIKEFLKSSDLSGSRSTILQPIIKFLAIIMAGILSLLIFGDKVPIWITITFVVAFAAGIIVLLFVYLYCVFNDKDAIRSEKYTIQKMAIEKGYYGDSATGMYKELPFERYDDASFINKEIEGGMKE